MSDNLTPKQRAALKAGDNVRYRVVTCFRSPHTYGPWVESYVKSVFVYDGVHINMADGTLAQDTAQIEMCADAELHMYERLCEGNQ